MANHTWEEIETCVRGRVMVKVSSRVGERDGAMLYSMRVGTAQLMEDGTSRVSSHMSIYDIADAVALLGEVSERYKSYREEERAGPRGIATRYRAAGRP